MGIAPKAQVEIASTRRNRKKIKREKSSIDKNESVKSKKRKILSIVRKAELFWRMKIKK